LASSAAFLISLANQRLHRIAARQRIFTNLSASVMPNRYAIAFTCRSTKETVREGFESSYVIRNFHFGCLFCCQKRSAKQVETDFRLFVLKSTKLMRNQMLPGPRQT